MKSKTPNQCKHGDILIRCLGTEQSSPAITITRRQGDVRRKQIMATSSCWWAKLQNVGKMLMITGSCTELLFIGEWITFTQLFEVASISVFSNVWWLCRVLFSSKCSGNESKTGTDRLKNTRSWPLPYHGHGLNSSERSFGVLLPSIWNWNQFVYDCGLIIGLLVSFVCWAVQMEMPCEGFFRLWKVATNQSGIKRSDKRQPFLVAIHPLGTS